MQAAGQMGLLMQRSLNFITLFLFSRFFILNKGFSGFHSICRRFFYQFVVERTAGKNGLLHFYFFAPLQSLLLISMQVLRFLPL